MKILLTGQCTLHWGRMEFGNIGNFYIMEPFLRELRRVFPESQIVTTFQMSAEFCQREQVSVLPMELYYAWRPDELALAQEELEVASKYAQNGTISKETPYINLLRECDLVIDFSGDIWGDNADLLGDDRFRVGLLKNRVSQLMGIPTVMLAGSPGPFGRDELREHVQEVLNGFSLVTTREPISIDLMTRYGFDTSAIRSYPCPSFLFEPSSKELGIQVLETAGLTPGNDNIVGFVLCGWNFTEGPFDKANRESEEYIVFAEAVEYLINELGVSVCLMSHSNGFPIPPEPFELIHGRDYPIIKQLQQVVLDRQKIDTNKLVALDGVYNAWDTKAIIGCFDMLVSGRVHAAVAGLSQNIPTVIIDYGHEPKAHKLAGFAWVCGVENFVADPADNSSIVAKSLACWQDRASVRARLGDRMREVKVEARNHFAHLSSLISS